MAVVECYALQYNGLWVLEVSVSIVDDLQLPPDKDADQWMYQINYLQARPYIPTNSNQHDIWQLLNDTIQYYAENEIHPQLLVTLTSLYQRYILTTDQCTKWSKESNTCHPSSTGSRWSDHALTMTSFVCQCRAEQNKPLCDDVSGLRHCFHVIHHLICDYILSSSERSRS